MRSDADSRLGSYRGIRGVVFLHAARGLACHADGRRDPVDRLWFFDRGYAGHRRERTSVRGGGLDVVRRTQVAAAAIRDGGIARSIDLVKLFYNEIKHLRGRR